MRHRISPAAQKGQATVEFALVLPILCMLLFAIVQFGIAFNHYLTLTDAVRAGARQAAVSRFVASPTEATTAKLRAAAGDLDDSALVVAVSAPGGGTPTWQPGSDVQVTASYPYSIDLLGVVVAAGSLSSSTIERVE